MKKYLLLCALLLVALSGCAAYAEAPETEEPQTRDTDDPRIASTSVAICRILDALEYGNVVGVPDTQADIPVRYEGARTIGSPMNPDYEIIKSISPDLVLSPQTLENSLAPSYYAAGISSAFLDLGSVEGMYGAISSLGGLLGREAEAQALVTEFEAYLESYGSADAGPSVLLLMAFPDGFYLVATENSYVGNLVKLAGGRNVYDDSFNGDESGFANISPEDVVRQAPDLILVFAHYSEDSAFEYMASEFESAAAWRYFDAVNEKRVHYLPSEYFGMSATLDWTRALEYLRPVLYGEDARNT